MNPVRLAEIAELIGAAVVGDSEFPINGVSSIESPRPGTVLYVDDMSNLKRLSDIDSKAIIVRDSPQGITGNFLVHPNPRVAFAKVSAHFHNPYWLEYTGKCPSACIEDGARIADTAMIGTHSFIGSGSIIKDNVRILPLVFIGRNVFVGRDTVILPGAVILDDTTIGERVIINSNAVIGSEGFGFVEDEGELVKVPQIGRVIIEDDVEVGACVTIDRGTIDDTVIGHGTRIDNLVQIGHNVKIGRNVRIAAQAGFSGRVKIDDNVIVGGQAGFQNGVTVGRDVRIAGQTAIFKSIPAGQTVSGYPAMPHGQALRLLALTKRLPEIIERLDAIEKKIMGIDL